MRQPRRFSSSKRVKALYRDAQPGTSLRTFARLMARHADDPPNREACRAWLTMKGLGWS